MIHPSELPLELVRDFQVFLDYIDHEKVTLTKTKGYMQRKHCYQLNQRFEVQNTGVTEKNDQIYYPRVHLFYYLALNGKLMTRKGNRLILLDRATEFTRFSDVEKYLFLLETLWVDTDWAVFTDHEKSVYRSVIKACGGILSQPPEQEIDVPGRTNVSSLFDMGHMVPVLSYFGLWNYTLLEKMESYKQSIHPASIKTTKVGWELLQALLLTRPVSVWNVPARKSEGEWLVNPGRYPEEGNSLIVAEDMAAKAYGLHFFCGDGDERFMDRFQDLFETDDLQQTFPREIEEAFQGTYTFRLTHGDATARVQGSAEHTMEDLHIAIQQSYEFEDVHLYSFFMTGKAWTEPSISSPEDWSSEQSADQVLIGETGLKQGDTILYVYDYGEEWRVKIKVEEMIEG
ncbi:IS1096 element passenger TnpR family protein [Halobacillus sp. K22]|uniref:IS1096 element passenger TnpR family protein n=1 Tax=Halobacillus sp. K22 TaxID=3457431 RepID=UPI003FCEDD9A